MILESYFVNFIWVALILLFAILKKHAADTHFKGRRTLAMKDTPCFLPGKDPAKCWGPDLDRGSSQKALKPSGILSSAAQGVNSAIDIVFLFF